MAFTIITIIFTPLGFFTSFFGMNHSLTGADWMTLANQCIYMFCISAAIIISALSLVFKGSQLRRFLNSLRDPKARWHDLERAWKGWKRRRHDEEPKPGEKTAGKEDSSQQNGTNDARAVGDTDEGRPNETNGAMHYFRQFGPLKGSRLSKLTSRNSQLRNDVENSMSEHNRETARPKTAYG
ncbi:hypothetical protein INS49_015439 [Diaporthe citri]|uniref:uncharacterized protein n=1 Tax=Diaporthe citri TaxID=83186 RepID=UPI001C80252E|nr:uncharacterized protein INS49_015439 [Diaporthe citri]KAG6356054.1 hypothetical protein INS49_015439 [Diaporthe citri]